MEFKYIWGKSKHFCLWYWVIGILLRKYGFNMFEIFWKNEKWCWKMWWMCRTIQNSGSDLFNIVSCSIAYGTRKVLILIVLYKHCYVPMADARRGLCLFNSLCILNRLIINFGIHDLLNVTMWIVIVFININK